MVSIVLFIFLAERKELKTSTSILSSLRDRAPQLFGNFTQFDEVLQNCIY
jgi:hypothetical protein